MKDKKTLVFLIIVAILVAAAFLIFISNESPQDQTSAEGSPDNTQTTSTQSTTTTVAPASSATQTPDWHFYENVDYGFSLSFSDAWAGYQAAKTADLSGISLARYDFSLTTSSSKYATAGGRATAITIYVIQKSVWNELPAKTVSWIKLGESPKYVYAYVTWQSAPNDLQAITDKEIANVLKTFKIGV